MPVAVAFDTLKFTKRLEESGFPRPQAEAQAEAFQEAQEAQLGDLATKGDLRELETRISGELRGLEARVNGELRLIKWMLAVVVAVTVLPALKTLLGL